MEGKPAIVLWGFTRAVSGSRPGSLWLCKTAALMFCPHVRVGHREALK